MESPRAMMRTGLGICAEAGGERARRRRGKMVWRESMVTVEDEIQLV
jgi:hypothetical protein